MPRSIALNLTVPERVTRFNLDRLQRMVAAGPRIHPGAKFIIRDDNMRFDLRVVRGLGGGPVHGARVTLLALKGLQA